MLMPLINLSEAYSKNPNNPIYKRIKMAFGLQWYMASSLSAIEEHFRESPPKRKRKDVWGTYPSAGIIIRGLEIKRKYPDIFFVEEDGVSLGGLDDGLCSPLFEIKDKSMKRPAYWQVGNSSEYVKAQEEFGFNRETYVPIPRTFLEYKHNNKGGLVDNRLIRLG